MAMSKTLYDLPRVSSKIVKMKTLVLQREEISIRT
jgi:hypothetical protein